MYIERLAKTYETKTDEELLQLASQSNELTPEADAALRSELARRRINPAEHFKPELTGEHTQARNAPGVLMGCESSGVAEFVGQALSVYHGHFWLFIKLVAPAVTIGCFAIIIGRNESREIARHIPGGVEILTHRAEFVEMLLAVLAGFFASWTAFSFSFAGICVGVYQLAAGRIPSVGECFAPVRERLVPFVLLSSLLFFFLLVGEAAASLLETGIFWVLHRFPVHLSTSAIWLITFACTSSALLVLSRFALAIPGLLLDNCKVGEAIFRSDDFTEGKWLILAVLLSKSLIGGYVAGMLPFWLASSILRDIPLPWWFPWALTAASIAAVTVVEPTMFIGFTLLYLRGSKSPSTSSEALAAGLA